MESGQKQKENLCPYKTFYMNAFLRTIFVISQLETTHISLNWEMDKQVVIYPFNALLLSTESSHKVCLVIE